MSTLQDVRSGLSRAWESLTIGWRELRELAGDALTRFHPKTSQAATEPAEERIVSRASRWGLLAAEVADAGDKLEVMLEAPGLEPENLALELREDVLVVRGEKKVAREQVDGHYYLMERAYGQFERAIRLPEAVREDGAKASYHAGVLTVSLPKARKGAVSSIPVES